MEANPSWVTPRVTRKRGNTEEARGTAPTPEKDKALISQGFSDFSGTAGNIESVLMVEVSGIEPLTSCMPCKRSPS
jgi:hypothetical protein